MFVKEVQHAVLDGGADVAVHSAKDLPSMTADGLRLGAFAARRDARDALVGATLADLAHGATVATGSVRRRAQLAVVRPDLQFVELRGNIATRLARCPTGGAIVMAAAALQILGLADRITELPRRPPASCPAAGQGCVAVECRADDDEMIAVLGSIDHHPRGTRWRSSARSSPSWAADARCRLRTLPTGWHADRLPGRRRPHPARVGDNRTDRRPRHRRCSQRGTGPIDTRPAVMTGLAGRTVVVTRAVDQAGDTVAQLASFGATAVELPLIHIVDDATGMKELGKLDLSGVDWIVVTSPNGARRASSRIDPRAATPKIAAVGSATAAALPRCDLVAPTQSAAGLLEVFPVGPGHAAVVQAGGAAPDTGRRAARAGLGRRRDQPLPDRIDHPIRRPAARRTRCRRRPLRQWFGRKGMGCGARRPHPAGRRGDRRADSGRRRDRRAQGLTGFDRSLHGGDVGRSGQVFLRRQLGSTRRWVDGRRKTNDG